MENIKLLKNLKKSIEKKDIHYSQMCSWNRQWGEGYNRGLSDVIHLINQRIKKYEKAATEGSK